MEILDEYQEQAMGPSQPPPVVDHHVVAANSIAGIAASIPHHRHNSESPMSHPEEDLSDPDRQDEESGEELPQQPLQGSNHSPPGAAAVPAPLTHLNNLMNSTHPHFLAKIKLENEMDVLSNKTSLEALQAAMSSSGFTLPFSFPGPAFLGAAPTPSPNPHLAAASISQQHGHSSSQSNSNNSISNNGSVLPSSSSSHSSESSHGSGRNGLETSNTPGQRDSEPGCSSGAINVHSQSGSQGPSSSHQQQPSWSFEEQFKQVRQLYEINDDPKRKEFLDDLFSFMQKRGTPINRLPIMAKSVLDLYELYNLVIARGGLVDVINKKLWQEIIKGLHLPSSITSAAFTLRTQYMKYLYPYECEKKRLSTPAELQAAIDGNRREGRRSNYTGGYGSGGSGAAESSMVQRSPHTPSSMHVSPLSLVSAVQQVAAVAGGQHPVNPQNLVNGSAAHTPLPHHPHHPQSLQASLGQPQNAARRRESSEISEHRLLSAAIEAGLANNSDLSVPGVAPDFEVRMAEYVKHLQREMDARRRAVVSPTSALLAQQQHRPGSTSPPTEATSREALLEMSRLTLWNMYNNNMHPAINYAHNISPHDSPHSPTAQPASPEPQKEALDLGLRSSPSTSSPPNRQSPPSSSGGSVAVKREIERSDSQPEQSTNKRLCLDEDAAAENQAAALPGTHIKISNRGDGRDNSMVVSMEINGVMCQGVLFAQAEAGASGNNSESKTSSRQVTS